MGTGQPHIDKWWAIANDRRQRLIVRKHKKNDLTPLQDKELVMLQKVADAILEMVHIPMKPFPPAIEKLLEEMDEPGCTGMGDPKPESTELT